MVLYEAHPTTNGMTKIDWDPKNKWLDAEEIGNLEANDGRVELVASRLANLMTWPLMITAFFTEILC
jgi:hypothetical protein